MKHSLLVAGTAAVFLALAARSQEPAAAVEPLLKVEPPPAAVEPPPAAVAPAPAVVKPPPAAVAPAPVAVKPAPAAVAPAPAAVKPPPAAPAAPAAAAAVPAAPVPVITEAEAARLAAAEAARLAAAAAKAAPPPPPPPPAAPAAPEAPAATVVTEAEGAPTAELTETAEGTISVTFEDTPMSEVIKLFSQLSGANIIAATSNLTGTVSVSLKNVAWQPAFESILSRHDLILSEKPVGSGIFVVESGRAGEEPSVTETIHLRYAKVDRMAELVNAMLGKTGRATPFLDGNAVLVQAPASKISEVKRIVESLDKARGQVYIEARFVEMTAAASKKLGLKWDSLDEWGVTARNLSAGAMETKGRLARYPTGTGSFIDHDGDPATPHVALPNLLVPDELSGTAGMLAGDAVWKRFRGQQGQLSADAFRLALSAFEKEDGVSVISNPKIIVANEETAVVDMTTKEPYVEVTASRSTSAGGNTLDITTKLGIIPGKNDPFVGEAFFSYGVSVKVQPRVSSSGVITVTIEPSISDRDLSEGDNGYFVIEGASDDIPMTKYPIISMKKIKTTFSMLDGSTAVIGGLTRSTESNVDSGIPYLRKIPWIGPRLFGWKGRQKGQSEIVIFVTVGIVDAELAMPENIGLPKNAVLSRDVKEPGDLPPGELMRLKK